MLELICLIFIVLIMYYAVLLLMRWLYVRFGWFKELFCNFLNYHVISDDMNIYEMDNVKYGYCKHCGRRLKYNESKMEWEDGYTFKFWS